MEKSKSKVEMIEEYIVDSWKNLVLGYEEPIFYENIFNTSIVRTLNDTPVGKEEQYIIKFTLGKDEIAYSVSRLINGDKAVSKRWIEINDHDSRKKVKFNLNPRKTQDINWLDPNEYEQNLYLIEPDDSGVNPLDISFE